MKKQKIAGVSTEKYFSDGLDETTNGLKALTKNLDDLISTLEVWENDCGYPMPHKEYLQKVREKVGFDVTCDILSEIDKIRDTYS